MCFTCFVFSFLTVISDLLFKSIVKCCICQMKIHIYKHFCCDISIILLKFFDSFHL